MNNNTSSSSGAYLSKNFIIYSIDCLIRHRASCEASHLVFFRFPSGVERVFLNVSKGPDPTSFDAPRRHLPTPVVPA